METASHLLLQRSLRDTKEDEVPRHRLHIFPIWFLIIVIFFPHPVSCQATKPSPSLPRLWSSSSWVS